MDEMGGVDEKFTPLSCPQRPFQSLSSVSYDGPAMKIYLETFGCQMNRLDSELLTAGLRLAGHEMVEDIATAEVVLYNTCSVRAHAEEKVFSRLGADAKRKSRRKRLIVGVLGCMAQRLGYELPRKFRAVDIVCAPGQLSQLPRLIEQAAAERECVVALDARRTDTGNRMPDSDGRDDPSLRPPVADPMASGIRHPVSGIRSTDFDRLDMGRDPRLTDAMAQAYVRVQEGCDRFCTYCIVPYVRGAENCRDPRHIVEEVGKLADTGHSEVTLLGQTVNRYRWSAGEATVRFSDLLSRVAGVAGLRRVRFVTSHPLDFGDDLLEAMRDLPNVCEYIHCPPQSGSDAVLKRMNRGYTRAQFDDLVDRARAIVPGVVLAGDFIVGFPGETEEDHQASMDLLRRSRFKNSFVFKYSPRPGTAAARKLADDVLDADKKRRNNELLAVQGEVGLAHHREYIGRTVEVLVEGPSLRAGKQPAAAPPGQVQLVGRTRWDHIVHFTAAPEIAGAYVNVRVTDATSLVMTGEMA